MCTLNGCRIHAMGKTWLQTNLSTLNLDLCTLSDSQHSMCRSIFEWTCLCCTKEVYLHQLWQISQINPTAWQTKNLPKLNFFYRRSSHRNTLSSWFFFLSQLPLPSNPPWYGLMGATDEQVEDISLIILRLYTRKIVSIPPTLVQTIV